MSSCKKIISTYINICREQIETTCLVQKGFNSNQRAKREARSPLISRDDCVRVNFILATARPKHAVPETAVADEEQGEEEH